MLVVCTGTATDVGKTYVGAAALAQLRRRGHTVSARKPAQSHDPTVAGPLDAALLAASTGEPVDDVCPPHRTYALPMAPPMAAAALGQPGPTLTALVAELAWPNPYPDVRWVELVGGPRSPLAVDGDGVDLTDAISADRVVLVADAGLGTINSVSLSVAPFEALGHRPVVILNRYDPEVDLHRRNWTWLTERSGCPVVTDSIALADALL